MTRRSLPARLPQLTLLAALACSALPPAPVHAAHADDNAKPAPRDLRETYTKYEYRIPMRDGTKLFTVVYVPKDASKSYPFLITRTPSSAGVQADGELH